MTTVMLSESDTKYGISSFEWMIMEKDTWGNKTQEAAREQSEVGPPNMACPRFLVT